MFWLEIFLHMPEAKLLGCWQIFFTAGAYECVGSVSNVHCCRLGSSSNCNYANNETVLADNSINMAVSPTKVHQLPPNGI